MTRNTVFFAEVARMEHAYIARLKNINTAAVQISVRFAVLHLQVIACLAHMASMKNERARTLLIRK